MVISRGTSSNVKNAKVKAANDSTRAITGQVLPDGCHDHSACPRWKRTGNTCNGVKFSEVAAKLSQESTHEVKGSPQLTPKEVKSIFKLCVSENTLFAYGMGVWMLLSISLFLRNEEGIRMTGESFFMNLAYMVGD